MIEIITVGDELTTGCTIDTNSSFIACIVSPLGYPVKRITTIGDGFEDIIQAFKNLSNDTKYVIVTGGLGPTEDDKTAQAASRYFLKKLVLNEEALNWMEKRFESFGRKMNKASRKQALLPEGASAIPNPVGTACGFLIEEKGRSFIFFPGVPAEVREMTKSFLLPHLSKNIGQKPVIMQKTFRLYGIMESEVQQFLYKALERSSIVSVAYYPHFPEISIKLTAKGLDKSRVSNELSVFSAIVSRELGSFIYSEHDEPIEAVVGALLADRSETMAVAESCTGGLISSRLTDVPGSSAYFERGVVVYSNRAKQDILNVPEKLINTSGAVSEPVASCLAKNIRNLSQTTYGISVTGIAGPSGGTPEKPVGTVFIGLDDISQGQQVYRFKFSGTREQIRLRTFYTTLILLKKLIESKHKS